MIKWIFTTLLVLFVVGNVKATDDTDLNVRIAIAIAKAKEQILEKKTDFLTVPKNEVCVNGNCGNAVNGNCQQTSNQTSCANGSCQQTRQYVFPRLHRFFTGQ